MGIQVHRTLLRQHAHARGHLKRLIRRQAPHPDILAQQQLLESLARVIDLQGMDEHWDREHTIEPRPKREFFPKGAYRRDALNIMRRAERPMRVAEILDALGQCFVPVQRQLHLVVRQRAGDRRQEKVLRHGLLLRGGTGQV